MRFSCNILFTSLLCTSFLDLVLLNKPTVLAERHHNKFVVEHDFIFISGWPQSGTSFMHYMLGLHPNTSTMVEGCELANGPTECMRYNHEGQWILSPPTLRSAFHSGCMCAGNGSISDETKKSILDTWHRYWSTSKGMLIEKSPQSMLKIPMLRKIFQGSKSSKFIILLKHPLSLNIATSKDFGWRYVINKQEQLQSFYRPTRKQIRKSRANHSNSATREEITFNQTLWNCHHFYDVMLKGNSTVPRNGTCDTHPKSLGWLPAMEVLYNQLKADAHSIQDVRIVRYEDFSNPVPLCKALWNFLLNPAGDQYSYYAANQTCDMLFSRGNLGFNSINRDNTFENFWYSLTVEKITFALSKLLYQKKISKSQLQQSQRSLRLHRPLKVNTTDIIEFMPELVTSTYQQRIKDFVWAFNNRFDANNRLKFNDIDILLRRYGYSLRNTNSDSSTTTPDSIDSEVVKLRRNSIFRSWELIK